MTPAIDQQTAQIGVRLLDDARIVWAAAQRECEHALRNWFDASPRDREARYFGYRAALDREEAAALDLQRLWELSEPCRLRLAVPETIE
jgi:hypothetical protein